MYDVRFWYVRCVEPCTPRTDHIFPLLIQHYSSWFRSGRQGRSIPDLYDLYDLVHAAGWKPYNVHNLAHLSWVGSVLCKSCTTYHNGRWWTRWSRWCRWSVRGVVRCARTDILFWPTLLSAGLGAQVDKRGCLSSTRSTNSTTRDTARGTQTT